MPKIRIGLIGYGGIGRVHAAAYRAIPFYYGLPADSIDIAGVATTRPETAKAAAEEIGCAFHTADYRELLARGDIDAVDICTPNNSHHAIVRAAAAAGKHIYCEKPLAMNVAEALSMAQAARVPGIKAQVTFNFRFFPAIARAKQLMDAGFVGRIFSFRGRYHRSSYIDSAKPMSWRLKREITGGGALFDLGSHILDLLYHLLGDFDAVYGTLDTLIKERPYCQGRCRDVPGRCRRHRFLARPPARRRSGHNRNLAHGHRRHQRSLPRNLRRQRRDPLGLERPRFSPYL